MVDEENTILTTEDDIKHAILRFTMLDGKIPIDDMGIIWVIEEFQYALQNLLENSVLSASFPPICWGKTTFGTLKISSCGPAALICSTSSSSS